jgi:bacterioferritin-associated ferredoxin
LPLARGEAETAFLAGLVTQSHVDHAVRSGVGVWVHEDSEEDAEHRSGGADSEGQGSQRGQRETGAFEELAERVAEILKCGVQMALPLGACCGSCRTRLRRALTSIKTLQQKNGLVRQRKRASQGTDDPAMWTVSFKERSIAKNLQGNRSANLGVIIWGTGNVVPTGIGASRWMSK